MHQQILLLIISSFFFISSSSSSSSSSSIAMATESSSEAKVHIVYTEKPDALIKAEDHHIKTLTSVLGSEDAAKASLLYVYTNAATGFSAKLTPHQVELLSTQPGVLQVVESQTLNLHSGGGHGIGKMHV